MKTILNWNDEYLTQVIACPLVRDEDAVKKLKELVTERLMALWQVKTKQDAEALVEAAYDPRNDNDDLHVSDYGASLLYGASYEERWTIVDAPQEFVCGPKQKPEANQQAIVEYGAFATNKRTGEKECVFTTPCSVLLCENRAKEKIQMFPGKYDTEITVKQRIVHTASGAWKPLRDVTSEIPKPEPQDDKLDRKYDLVLLERPGEKGLTLLETVALYTHLNGKGEEAYPFEVEAELVESCAMGFITPEAASSLEYEYLNLNHFLSRIMDDMTNETETGEYTFQGLKILLTRNIV